MRFGEESSTSDGLAVRRDSTTARRNVVLFTGQVRVPEQLLSSIDQLDRQRRNGLCDGVLLSTWRGELDGQAGLRAGLRERSVEVLELDPPADAGPGAVWSQMRSLEGAIAAVGTEAHILKTRPEVVLADSLLDRLLGGGVDLRVGAPAGAPPILTERIWAPWFHTLLCFHLGDECFYGRGIDLRRLNNDDARFDTDFGYPGRLAHVRRYAPVVLPDFPIFEDHLRTYAPVNVLRSRADRLRHPSTAVLESMLLQKRPWGPGTRPWVNHYSVLAAMTPALLASPRFRRILAGYYLVLSWYFAFDGEPDRAEVIFRQRPNPQRFPLPGTFTVNLARNGRAEVRDYGGHWLRAVLDGDVGDEPEALAFVAELRRIEADPSRLCTRVPAAELHRDTKRLDEAKRAWMRRNRGAVVSAWLDQRAPDLADHGRRGARAISRRVPRAVKDVVRRAGTR